MYHAARGGRLTSGWGAGSTSADAEVANSLSVLRSRSRALIRDASYAKRAQTIVVNNVVGSGIGLQAQVVTTRNGPADRANSAIEAAWASWSRAARCHTGGTLALADVQRLLMAEVFEAGEVLVRMHRRPFGDSAVPLALEVIESERLADEYTQPLMPGDANVRMGVEADAFGRPVAYWIRRGFPGDVRRRVDAGPDVFDRVPAEDVLHLRLVDRWPQTRGVPWMHTAMRRLNDMDGYSEAEIVAARAAANIVGFIKAPEAPDLGGNTAVEGAPVDGAPNDMPLEPGEVRHLAPGEDFVGFDPSRPNPALSEFMRHMLREVAAGAGVSYESLSRDYSQSNYSSSRLALLDDRDSWRVLQQWFIRGFMEPVFRQWLHAAVLARAIPGVSVTEYALNPEKFEAVRWKPRGWSWVDPTKEVNAYKEAIRAGLTTLTDVISATGGGLDIEDVIETRRRELQLLDEAGIDVDTTVEEPVEPMQPRTSSRPAADAESGSADPEDDNATAQPARVLRMAKRTHA